MFSDMHFLDTCVLTCAILLVSFYHSLLSFLTPLNLHVQILELVLKSIEDQAYLVEQVDQL